MLITTSLVAVAVVVAVVVVVFSAVLSGISVSLSWITCGCVDKIQNFVDIFVVVVVRN